MNVSNLNIQLSTADNDSEEPVSILEGIDCYILLIFEQNYCQCCAFYKIIIKSLIMCLETTTFFCCHAIASQQNGSTIAGSEQSIQIASSKLRADD
jgi:hypothetical protein